MLNIIVINPILITTALSSAVTESLNPEVWFPIMQIVISHHGIKMASLSAENPYPAGLVNGNNSTSQSM
ncbi:MAG: hypothetical protein R2778_05865 [Saprospiraceae bacterium]